MPYIWENYFDNKRYQIAKNMCPYLEILTPNSQLVDVNPLIRFSNIFNATFFDNQREDFAIDVLSSYLEANGISDIVNIIFHYLSQLDRVKGLDRSQRTIERLRYEIENGVWGETAKKLMNQLSCKDQEHILFVLSKRMFADNQSFFMEAISKSFPISSLCYEDKTEMYYLYIGSEHSEYNDTKFELIKYLFWTIELNLTVIWNYHYGIVGCDDTMCIGNIQVV